MRTQMRSRKHIQKEVLADYFERSTVLRAACAKDPRQVKWHPLMIRWCLNLKLLSSAAYHATQTTGFIRLPSERTLRDYTHYFKSQTGFQQEVNQQLQKEANLEVLPECQRFCGLVVDEMQVKENLVYDKYTGDIVGLISLGISMTSS